MMVFLVIWLNLAGEFESIVYQKPLDACLQSRRVGNVPNKVFAFRVEDEGNYYHYTLFKVDCKKVMQQINDNK